MDSENISQYIYYWRSGKFIFISPSKSIKLMVGSYVDGELEGDGRISYETGEVEELEFKKGCIHGLVRRLNKKGEVIWVSNYHLGKQRGVTWTFLEGGGILVTGL